MPGPVLDTNVLLRHLLDDHQEHSPRASALIEKIEAGELAVELPPTAVFEAVFTLEKTFKRARRDIRDQLQPILGWRSVAIADRSSLVRAFDLYVEHNISFADAYHAAIAEKRIPPEIVSFDKGIDRVKGVRRIEP